MRVGLTLFILLCALSTVFAQYLNFQQVDSITYVQYLNKDYKTLQKTGKSAINEGYDFYYLRMRLGISYYEESNYEIALVHFQKANLMNPTDTLLQEYLFFSYLFTGRRENAYDLAQTFSDSLQLKIGHQQFSHKKVSNWLETVSVDGGYLINDNIEQNQNADFLQGAVYAESTLQGSMNFGSVYLKSRMTPRLNVYNSFSVFHTTSLGIVQSSFNSSYRKSYSNVPWQYNFAMDYILKSGFRIGGAFGLYQESADFLSSSFDQANLSYTYKDQIYEHLAYTSSIYLNYHLRNFEFILSGSTGNLASVNQLQGDFSLVYYPFGNQNFYTLSTATFLNNDETNSFIFSQKVGFKISKSLWFEVNGSYGNMRNFIKANGFETYNSIDPLLHSTAALLRIQMKNLRIIPSYSFSQRESSFYRFVDNTNEVIILNNYSNHRFKLSILWNF